MTVLVTGGTGFVGSHLIERLRRQGHDVRCVAKDRLNVSMLESLDVQVVLGDLNNGIGWDAILDGVDVVYHLAGVTRARSYKEYYEGNYLATKRFVEVCSVHCRQLRRFLYVSSLTAVGPSLAGQRTTEETPCHPVSHYGKSKMLAESEVMEAAQWFPVTIVRPSAVYGPRERDMYEYMKLIMRGIQPLIGFGQKFLNLIHASDLVDGIIHAAESPRAEGETYLLGSETDYTMEEIGKSIALAVQKSPVRIRVPHSLVYAVGAVAELVGKISGKQIFFNLQKVRESIQSAWTCSVEKARSQLGFRQNISLDEGMAQTYRWYCDHQWL